MQQKNCTLIFAICKSITYTKFMGLTKIKEIIVVIAILKELSCSKSVLEFKTI